MKFDSLAERAQIYKGIILSGKRLVILAGVSGALLFAIYAFTKTASYIAHTTFHPDETKNGGLGSMGDPLSFVFGGASKQFNAKATNQMIGVLQSRHLSELVAQDSIMRDGEQQLLADLILNKKAFSLHPYYIFKKLASLFTTDDPPTYENKIIYAGLNIRRKLEVETNDNDFVIMSFTFHDVQLTQKISEVYISKLEEYYTAQQTEKAKLELDFFTLRADSVRGVIDNISGRLAVYTDKTYLATTAQAARKRAEYETQLEYLTEMYKTLIIQREQAVTKLQQKTPIIQVLDRPLPPFEIVASSPILLGILGAILFAILTVFYLVREPLKEDMIQMVKDSLEDNSSQST